MLVRAAYLLLMLRMQCLCLDLTYYVEEEQGPGTYLGDIASDTHLLDTVPSEEHSLVRFSLLQQRLAPNPSLFRVSKKTGKLYTAQTLDAEALCTFNTDCYRILKVAARRAEAFMKILKIKVVIKDINDNEPSFPEQRIQIQFSEADGPGVRRIIPNAIDNDIDVLNSKVTYQLRKNPVDPFSLSVLKSVDGISDLSILLEGMLDYEVKTSYDVQVIAKDSGLPPKQSVLKVHIGVKDINDNPPMFTQSIYNVSIRSEHSKTAPIVVLSASDADGVRNSKISYQLSPKTSLRAQQYFKLNDVTGEIFLQSNFEPGQKPVYKLFVRAIDNGTPALSAIATVLVNVINQQNTAPRIDISFVSDFFRNTASISEDISVGSFIAYVMVTDNDIGHNGEVRCSLNHDKFQLQSLGNKEYKITVKDELDRETKDHFDVTINCWDNATPPLLGDKKFSIQLIDVNDVHPVLTKDNFMFWIYENQKSKFPVGNVPASDPDLGNNGQISYSLVSNDKKLFLPFEISSSGFISTVMSLDHEFEDVYQFQVSVKDNGVPQLSSIANVTVEVRDENDNAPYFTFPTVNPYILAVEYYPYRSKNITVLKAFDIDSRENAFLKFEIQSGNEQQLFAVSPYNGVLSFAREATQHDAGSYPLDLIVKDSGSPMLSSTTKVILELTVTNKTSEVMNTVLSRKEEKVHVNVLIAILVISVLLSVPVTASLSFCIMRFKERRDAQRSNKMNQSSKGTPDHGHYSCPSHETTYYSGIPPSSHKTDVKMNTLLTKAKKGIYSSEDSKKKGKEPVSDDIYQEIDEKMEEKRFMSLDYHTYNTDGWIDEDADLNKGLTDMYSSHYDQPHEPHPNKSSGPPKKGAKPHASADSKNTTTVSRSLYKVNIGHVPDCSKWTALPDGNDTNHGSPNKKNTPTKTQPGNRIKPPTPARKLPPIPTVPSANKS